ncbi:hypothetical protein ON010_g7833 [Phytophthora cinnamomi]|nr:hypothetical protein ON010_g7833 [Phytophthora cinnamomi]
MLEEITGEKVYGTHSIRKGVARFASSGSTGGPSIESVCLRCGWSLGGVQGRYFRYEAAGGQYLGRVVAGLRHNSVEFAALPPHFTDPNDAFVQDCTLQMFPALKQEAHITPVLQLRLASIVTHAEFLRKTLQLQHALLSSFVLRYPDILNRFNVMLSTGSSSWMRATGISPHVELFQQHQETHRALSQLPGVLLDGFATLREEKCVGQQNITRENISSTIRDLLQEAGLWRAHEEIQQMTARSDPCNIVYHWKSDGRFHRMPEAFIFPLLDALSVWCMWWLGHPAAGYPPFRALQPSDFTKSNRKTFSEWTVLVRHIVAGVEASTGQSMQKPSSQQAADDLYRVGMTNISLKQPRHGEKQRPDRAITTLRRIRQAIQEANPEVRPVPFRTRNRALSE